MLHTADEENIFINTTSVASINVFFGGFQRKRVFDLGDSSAISRKKEIPVQMLALSRNLQMFIDWRYFETREMYQRVGPVVDLEYGAWKSRVEMRSEASHC